MTEQNEMVNEMVLRTYTLPRFMKGKSIEDTVDGGDQIQDMIYMDLKSGWERIDPNVSLDYDNFQTGTVWTVPWTFACNKVSYTMQETDLNKDKYTGKYRTQAYKKVIRQKHQNMWTDTCNQVDAEFWAQPNAELMELTSTTPSAPRVPYSLPVFVNETSDASNPTEAGVNGLPSPVAAEWSATTSNVMGIPPGTKTKWQNQRESYDFGVAAADAAKIFAPMSKLMYKVSFDRLPRHAEYSDKRTNPHVILTNLAGIANYEHALRVNQDTFRGVGKTSGQDPDYDKPTFRGIPVDYISALDTAAIYPTAVNEGFSTWDDTANNTNTGDAGTSIGFAGPRYYFINGEYFKFVMHSDHFFKLYDPFIPSNQPFTIVQVMDLWNNFICRSRMRQGILYPGTADITSV